MCVVCFCDVLFLFPLLYFGQRKCTKKVSLISKTLVNIVFKKTSMFTGPDVNQASQTHYRDLTPSEGPLALVKSRINNPLAADYTEGMTGPKRLRASPPGRPPHSGPDVVGLLEKDSLAYAHEYTSTDLYKQANLVRRHLIKVW